MESSVKSIVADSRLTEYDTVVGLVVGGRGKVSLGALSANYDYGQAQPADVLDSDSDDSTCAMMEAPPVEAPLNVYVENTHGLRRGTVVSAGEMRGYLVDTLLKISPAVHGAAAEGGRISQLPQWSILAVLEEFLHGQNLPEMIRLLLSVLPPESASVLLDMLTDAASEEPAKIEAVMKPLAQQGLLTPPIDLGPAKLVGEVASLSSFGISSRESTTESASSDSTCMGDEQILKELLRGEEPGEDAPGWQVTFARLHEACVADVMDEVAAIRLGNFVTDFRVIVSEKDFRYRSKSIKPVTGVGGIAGGDKFSAGGIFFKFAVDKHGLYGSDATAAKAASHELRAISNIFDVKESSIQVPLSCVVNYKGVAVIAQSLVPGVGSESLVYGSKDGGATVIDSDAHVSSMMRDLGKVMNLCVHESAGVDMAFCGDLEAHKLPYGQYVLLDLARIMPPEPPQPVTKRVKTFREAKYEHTNFVMADILTRHLRPELVQRWNAPLCSDAFTLFDSDNVARELHEEDVRACYRNLVEVVIPKFAVVMESECLLHGYKSLDSLSPALHRRGINVRHLNKLYDCAESNTSRTLIMAEIAARSHKDLINRLFLALSRSDSRGIALEYPYVQTFIAYVNRITVPESSLGISLWNEASTIAMLKFRSGNNGNLKDIVSKMHAGAFIYRLMEICGMEHSTAGLGEIFECEKLESFRAHVHNDERFVLHDGHISGLQERVKAMSIANETVGRKLFRSARLFNLSSLLDSQGHSGSDTERLDTELRYLEKAMDALRNASTNQAGGVGFWLPRLSFHSALCVGALAAHQSRTEQRVLAEQMVALVREGVADLIDHVNSRAIKCGAGQQGPSGVSRMRMRRPSVSLRSLNKWSPMMGSGADKIMPAPAWRGLCGMIFLCLPNIKLVLLKSGASLKEAFESIGTLGILGDLLDSSPPIDWHAIATLSRDERSVNPNITQGDAAVYFTTSLGEYSRRKCIGAFHRYVGNVLSRFQEVDSMRAIYDIVEALVEYGDSTIAGPMAASLLLFSTWYGYVPKDKAVKHTAESALDCILSAARLSQRHGAETKSGDVVVQRDLSTHLFAAEHSMWSVMPLWSAVMLRMGIIEESRPHWIYSDTAAEDRPGSSRMSPYDRANSAFMLLQFSLYIEDLDHASHILEKARADLTVSYGHVEGTSPRLAPVRRRWLSHSSDKNSEPLHDDIGSSILLAEKIYQLHLCDPEQAEEVARQAVDLLPSEMAGPTDALWAVLLARAYRASAGIHYSTELAMQIFNLQRCPSGSSELRFILASDVDVEIVLWRLRTVAESYYSTIPESTPIAEKLESLVGVANEGIELVSAIGAMVSSATDNCLHGPACSLWIIFASCCDLIIVVVDQVLHLARLQDRNNWPSHNSVMDGTRVLEKLCKILESNAVIKQGDFEPAKEKAGTASLDRAVLLAESIHTATKDLRESARQKVSAGAFKFVYNDGSTRSPPDILRVMEICSDLVVQCANWTGPLAEFRIEASLRKKNPIQTLIDAMPSGIPSDMFVPIACGMTVAVARQLHAHNIIHGALDPATFALELFYDDAFIFERSLGDTPLDITLKNEGQGLRVGSILEHDPILSELSSPYSPPEVLTSSKSTSCLGYECDLYSLGVMFHEILTGKKPRSDGPASCLQYAPPCVNFLVSHLLAPSPQDRFRSARDLYDSLLETRSTTHDHFAYLPRIMLDRIASPKWNSLTEKSLHAPLLSQIMAAQSSVTVGGGSSCLMMLHEQSDLGVGGQVLSSAREMLETSGAMIVPFPSTEDSLLLSREVLCPQVSRVVVDAARIDASLRIALTNTNENILDLMYIDPQLRVNPVFHDTPLATYTHDGKESHSSSSHSDISVSNVPFRIVPPKVLVSAIVRVIQKLAKSCASGVVLVFEDLINLGWIGQAMLERLLHSDTKCFALATLPSAHNLAESWFGNLLKERSAENAVMVDLRPPVRDDYVRCITEAFPTMEKEDVTSFSECLMRDWCSDGDYLERSVRHGLEAEAISYNFDTGSMSFNESRFLAAESNQTNDIVESQVIQFLQNASDTAGALLRTLSDLGAGHDMSLDLLSDMCSVRCDELMAVVAEAKKFGLLSWHGSGSEWAKCFVHVSVAVWQMLRHHFGAPEEGSSAHLAVSMIRWTCEDGPCLLKTLDDGSIYLPHPRAIDCSKLGDYSRAIMRCVRREMYTYFWLRPGYDVPAWYEHFAIVWHTQATVDLGSHETDAAASACWKALFILEWARSTRPKSPFTCFADGVVVDFEKRDRLLVVDSSNVRDVMLRMRPILWEGANYWGGNRSDFSVTILKTLYEAERGCGRLDIASTILDEMLAWGCKNDEQKCVVYEMALRDLISKSQCIEAIEMGKNFLVTTFGVRLPEDESLATIQGKLASLVGQIMEGSFIPTSSAINNDWKEQKIRSAMVELMPAAYLSQNFVFYLLAIQTLLQRSIDYGVDGYTTVGISALGSVLGNISGNAKPLGKFVDITLALVDRLEQDPDGAPSMARTKAVTLLELSFCGRWVLPAKASRDYAKEAYTESRKLGNTAFASYPAMSCAFHCVATSMPLEDVITTAEDLAAGITLEGDRMAAHAIRSVTISARIMSGAPGFSVDRDEATLRKTVDLPPLPRLSYLVYGCILPEYMMNQDPYDIAQLGFEESLLKACAVFEIHFELHLFFVLAGVRHMCVHPDSKDTILPAVEAAVSRLVDFSRTDSVVYVPRAHLVRGELLRLEGKFVEALVCFSECKAACVKEKLLYVACIASERSADCFHSLKLYDAECSELANAEGLAKAWGATRVSDRLSGDLSRLRRRRGQGATPVADLLE